MPGASPTAAAKVGRKRLLAAKRGHCDGSEARRHGVEGEVRCAEVSAQGREERGVDDGSVPHRHKGMPGARCHVLAGMTLEQVTLGFNADIEVALPTWAAKPLLDSGTTTVLEQDPDWAVIAVSGVEMEITAHLRVESEDVEITELWISLRED